MRVIEAISSLCIRDIKDVLSCQAIGIAAELFGEGIVFGCPQRWMMPFATQTCSS